MTLSLPDFSLVMLIGPASPEKDAFVARHFSSDDRCCDPAVIEHRLAQRKLVCVSAPFLDHESRIPVLQIAKAYDAPAIGFVFNLGARPDDRARRQDYKVLSDGLHKMNEEGYAETHIFSVADAAARLGIVRQPLSVDRRGLTGPFDIIGDVHGCISELEDLLETLGYRINWAGSRGDPLGRCVSVTPPAGRTAVFVGDVVDRGPSTPDVLRLVMSMVDEGTALTVLGNHDRRFFRWLEGQNVRLTHGLDVAAAQMDTEPQAFHDKVRAFLAGLDHHIWCDGGDLVIAHAGIREDYIGRESRRVRSFCLYGDTAGRASPDGLPVRYHWAAEYRGRPAVVYGHTPVPDAQWLNNTLCIDTGCCFGGQLTCVRWPEREIVTVPARQEYAARRRPFGHPPLRPDANPTAEALAAIATAQSN